MQLAEEPKTQTALITYPDGSQARFGAAGDGTYTAPQVAATVTGGGWSLMDKFATTSSTRRDASRR